MPGSQARLRSQGEKGDCCGKSQTGAGREGQRTKEEYRKGVFFLQVGVEFGSAI